MLVAFESQQQNVFPSQHVFRPRGQKENKLLELWSLFSLWLINLAPLIYFICQETRLSQPSLMRNRSLSSQCKQKGGSHLGSKKRRTGGTHGQEQIGRVDCGFEALSRQELGGFCLRVKR